MVKWPLGAHAQPAERVRCIGVLMNLSSDDLEGQALRLVAPEPVECLEHFGVEPLRAPHDSRSCP